jgi:DNA-binding NtrC family response regulator
MPPEEHEPDRIPSLAEAITAGRTVLLALEHASDLDRIKRELSELASSIEIVRSPAEALEKARERAPALLVVGRGAEREWERGWLESVRQESPGTPILLLPATREASGEEIAAPIRDILLRSERVLASRPERRRRGDRRHAPPDPFLGESDAIRDLRKEAEKALESESPVLIEGETGTGKGVLAEWLHHRGPRMAAPFVDLNCAGFSRELLESELFGHERGSFTGAVSSKSGLLEVAEGGTLFLDEIGDMEPSIQAKLLKVIEERRFRRIGETRERIADVRIITATHHDLSQLVREGRFREDLYYRIRVLSLHVPALRERAIDIPILSRAVIRMLARLLGRPEPVLSAEAARVLSIGPWPGNLRELRNALERAMLAAREGPIEAAHIVSLTSEMAPRPVPEESSGTLRDVERTYIERVLEQESNVERAAQRLGIPRSTLYQKLRSLGIPTRR